MDIFIKMQAFLKATEEAGSNFGGKRRVFEDTYLDVLMLDLQLLRWMRQIGWLKPEPSHRFCL